MEILDKNSDDPQLQYRRKKNIYIGSAIALCGIVWLMGNFDMVSDAFFNRFFSWQVLIMALGGYFLVFKKWIVGFALLFAGLAFALGEWFGLSIHVKQIILPMMLIAAGIAVMLQRK